MNTSRKRLSVLLALLGLVVPASLFAEEVNDLFLQIEAGALSGFQQSGGQYPTAEFGIRKALSIGAGRTTGIYLGHGGAKTTVSHNNLIPSGEIPILLTHLLLYHSFELTESWTGSIEYGFSAIGFDNEDTSLSLIGLGFGAGFGYTLWNDWLLTFKTRHVTVDQSYLGDLIQHRQLSGSIGLAIPVHLPKFPW